MAAPGRRGNGYSRQQRSGALSNVVDEPEGRPFPFIRQQQHDLPPEGDSEDVDLSDLIQVDETKPSVVVDFPDGSVQINWGGLGAASKDLRDLKFDENLADALSREALGVLAEELLEGIQQDEMSRQDWLDERAEGIKLLALKIEKPSSASAGSAGGIDNTSRSRSTLLLEAALRFQANARAELLPTDGPVKVEAKLSKDSIEGDDLAQLLEDDMNYYLMKTASEYYPDTDRMLLWACVGGTGFKKVYRCPIRRRPVSESVDAADLIVSNNATDLLNADRVTFRVLMRQSTMKRMKHMEVYRDVDLAQPSQPLQTSVDEQKSEVTGITVSMRPEDAPYEVYECYCMVDVPGDEHKEGGKVTGLPRPYKISIEKSSREILEIRRNWHDDDEMERPREVFVKYPYVPGFGFYELGLIHIAGNPTVAATAILRIMIDAGIFGNFPGGLVSKSSDKQNTTDINVAPGSFAPIDTSMIQDGDIRKACMPLPYKSADGAIFQLYQDITQSGSRVAGVADINVGEGKQDAPVGTTIALIEQATKLTDAVHKRMHTAQAKEIELLRDLFKEYPEDFWKFNMDRNPNWDKAKLLKALNDYNLVPRSDPNTSSQMQRIMRAQAVYQMAQAHPELFQPRIVQEWILRIIGIRNPEGLMSEAGSENRAPPLSPQDQAKQTQAQADQVNAAAKLADVQLRAKNMGVENQNRDKDRSADLAIQQMKLKSEQLIHGKDQALDAAAQISAQQHETGITKMGHQHEAGLAQAQMQSDHALAAKQMMSDHALQQKDNAGKLQLQAEKPASPASEIKQ